MQRHGSHHSLNVVHNIYTYREKWRTTNIRQISHCMWRVGVKSTGHTGGLGLFFFHGGRRVDAVCGGQQWSWVRDAVDYLTYLQEIGTSTHQTRARWHWRPFVQCGCFDNYPGPASIVEFHKLLIHHETRTYLSPVDYTCRMLKQSCCRWNAENGLEGRFPSCRMQRMHMKNAKNRKTRKELILCIVFFACMHFVFRFLTASQAVRATIASRVLRTKTWKPRVGLWKQTVSELLYATQWMQHMLVMRRRSKKLQRMQHTHTHTRKTQRTQGKNRLRLAWVAYFGFLIASLALRVLRTTVWKPHVGLWVGQCDIQLFTFLWWVSGSAVRGNVM